MDSRREEYRDWKLREALNQKEQKAKTLHIREVGIVDDEDERDGLRQVLNTR